MSAGARGDDTAVTSGAARALTAIGSIALVLAMVSDCLAVIGRQLRMPFLGSIELVQACVVLAASAAILGATLTGAHAVVSMFTERLRPPAAAALRRFAAALSAAFFAALAAGSIWIAVELWGSHEQSELLGIPLRWLRLVWCASALAAAVLFLRTALGRPRHS